eukprot:574554-Hanusia_phi.AAC.1
MAGPGLSRSVNTAPGGQPEVPTQFGAGDNNSERLESTVTFERAHCQRRAHGALRAGPRPSPKHGPAVRRAGPGAESRQPGRAQTVGVTRQPQTIRP